ncbi:MAG: hypothetical protein M3O86_03135 [Actinomycetota bacterium]|nr:hypothetical protein [Actinomycetota bacterium]
MKVVWPVVAATLALSACAAPSVALRSEGDAAVDVAPEHPEPPDDATAERQDAALAAEQRASEDEFPQTRGKALWWPAPEVVISPQSKVFDVMVLELGCASGKTAEGRIKEPTIERRARAVVVTFTVRPLDGAVACPSHRPTPHRLDLGRPLGNRTLLDGGTRPPRPAQPFEHE